VAVDVHGNLKREHIHLSDDLGPVLYIFPKPILHIAPRHDLSICYLGRLVPCAWRLPLARAAVAPAH
jgi:hypothetical protein